MTQLEARAGDKDAGRKVKYFVTRDMQVSQSQFTSLKRSGGLQVNGAVVHADYVLRSGDLVTVLLPEGTAGKTVTPEAVPVRIIYVDEDIYIIDKEAPLACQCTPKQPRGTLENRLYAHFSDAENFVFRPLNRLDRGTSGLMAAAKHPHACQILQKQLHTPDFVREYLAVVEGEMQGEGRIDLPIAKEEAATVRRIVDFERGHSAATRYRVEAQANGRSLVRLQLETGRTHQIRVHLSAVGHPIAGDFLYGTELDALPGRFALHSTFIRLRHPRTGEFISLSSPLPDELKELLYS